MECRSPVEGAPVYRVDNAAETTIYFVGTDPRLEFVDLLSGREVSLREDNFNYHCEEVEP
jgi:hypothetical protein